MTNHISDDSQYSYVGNELEIFELAENWKNYLASRMKPYISGRVLEVGAGLGANTRILCGEDTNFYLALEPDPQLCKEYKARQLQGKISSYCNIVNGTLESLSTQETFDTIIYIDVLEHIVDDHREVQQAYIRLRPGGHLLVLSPAHGHLYSPFDKEIGHLRRYNKKMYRNLLDHSPEKLEYLDSIGMFASLLNRIVLKQTYPSRRQILVWDRLLVRMSRIVDPIVLRTVGKSILGVWKRR